MVREILFAWPCAQPGVGPLLRTSLGGWCGERGLNRPRVRTRSQNPMEVEEPSPRMMRRRRSLTEPVRVDGRVPFPHSPGSCAEGWVGGQASSGKGRPGSCVRWELTGLGSRRHDRGPVDPFASPEKARSPRSLRAPEEPCSRGPWLLRRPSACSTWGGRTSSQRSSRTTGTRGA